MSRKYVSMVCCFFIVFFFGGGWKVVFKYVEMYGLLGILFKLRLNINDFVSDVRSERMGFFCFM